MPIYLQIQDGIRLTVRMGRGNALERVHSRIMYETLREVGQICLESREDIRCEKAGRFRGGKSADVAELTFEGKDSWLAADVEGIVDLDASVQRLCHVRELLNDVAHRLTASAAL